MQDVETTDLSRSEQLMRLKGRAETLGELPMFSQAAAAREIVSDALYFMIEMAKDLEALKPFADEDEGDADAA